MKSVPCETCGSMTDMLGTRRCDACYEVEKRLPAYLGNIKGRAFARNILIEHVGQRAKDEEAAREQRPAISFEPADLQAVAVVVEKLRLSFLFEGDISGASVMAEPHFLIALSLLEQAALNFKLASYHQAQANAGRRQ
jgi:hypothetical protein